MTTAPQDEDQLFDEAVDLIIRLQNDPGNLVALDMSQQWCARSPRHKAIWSEAAEIYGMTGKILTERREAGQAEAGASISRRTLLLGGLTITGAAGLYGAPRLAMKMKADFMTAAAEIRHLSLADGTAVTLGPESAIAIDVAGPVRRADLMDGMAFFDIAQDTTRPFEVRAGAATARSSFAAFDVSHENDSTTISVDRGAVTVQSGMLTMADAQLADGEWLSVSGDDTAFAKGLRETDQIAAWRNGVIVADREPVAAVVARVARWQHGKVLLASPSLGRQRISGVFDLADPLRALEAIVHPYGGKVREMSPYLTIISAV